MLIAAVIAVLLFPVTNALLIRASNTIDGVTLLAAYHTAYNVVGVAVLLPLIDRFTRLIERILPERRSAFTRCLDPAALVTPLATEEAVRRTVARSLGAMCRPIGAALAAGNDGNSVRNGQDAASLTAAVDALRQAREFMQEASGPPESEEEQGRLTSTLHALDEASRLAEVVGANGEFELAPGEPEIARAAEFCAMAMHNAVLVADEVGALPSTARDAAAFAAPDGGKKVAANGTSIEQAMLQLEYCAKALRELQPAHRKGTLRSLAAGAVSADQAFAGLDAVRRFEALTRHAWLSAGHLVGG